MPCRGRGRGRGGGHRNQHSNEQADGSDNFVQPNSSETPHDPNGAPVKEPVDDNKFDSSAAKAFLDARWEAASACSSTVKHKQQQSAWGNGRVPFSKTDFAAKVLEKAKSSA
jgi:hypothetical protein